MFEHFRRLYGKRVDATGLALFRIAYCTVLLCEVLQLFYFRHLIFDTVPFLQHYELDFTFALLAWVPIILCLIFGFATRSASIANYLMTLVFFSTISTFEYHMFYAYTGLNFLLMFLPLDRRLSVDNLRRRLSAPYEALPPSHHRVSALAYMAPLFLGIAVVYLDSLLYKWTSPLWINGLGLWLPASLPHLTHAGQMQWLLNLEWVMYLLGYLTIVFETLFIFVFWFRRAWFPLFAIGVGLHVGILVFFPIPWFALSVIGLYLLLVPNTVWRSIADRLGGKAGEQVTAHYNARLLWHLKIKAVFTHFDLYQRVRWLPKDEADAREITVEATELEGVDVLVHLCCAVSRLIRLFSVIFKAGPLHTVLEDTYDTYRPTPREDLDFAALPTEEERRRSAAQVTVHAEAAPTYAPVRLKLFIVSVFVFVFLQFNASCQSPWGLMASRAVGLDKLPAAQELSRSTLRLSRVLFGITPHSLFMESHFKGYHHIVAVVHIDDAGKEVWLPIIDESGGPDWYIYGGNWAKWTFRVNSPTINQRQLEAGLFRFVSFWTEENDVQRRREARFIIKVKKIDAPSQWTRDFLEKQRAKPWVDAGEMGWRQSVPYVNLQEIESF